MAVSRETKYGPLFRATVCAAGLSIIFLKQKSGSALRTGFPILLPYCCVNCESGHDKGCTKHLKEVVYSRSTVSERLSKEPSVLGDLVARDNAWIRISFQESRKRVGKFRGKHSVDECPLAALTVAPSTDLCLLLVTRNGSI